MGAWQWVDHAGNSNPAILSTHQLSTHYYNHAAIATVVVP